MDRTITTLKTPHSQFLLLPTRQRNGDQRTKTVPSSMSNLWTHHQHQKPHGKQLENLMLLLGSSPEPRVLGPFGKNRRHNCLSRNAGAILFTQSSFGPLRERLRLPYPDEEILSGYKEDVSFIRDRFSTWVKADVQHYFGTTRGRCSGGPCGISRGICQKARHICSRILLRQHRVQPFIRTKTAEHLQLESRTSVWKRSRNKLQASGISSLGKKRLRMLSTSFSRIGSTLPINGLFNKDTFFPNDKVKSIYLHDVRRVLLDKVMQGDSGWGFTGRTVACFFSSATSQRPKNFHSAVVARQ